MQKHNLKLSDYIIMIKTSPENPSRPQAITALRVISLEVQTQCGLHYGCGSQQVVSRNAQLGWQLNDKKIKSEKVIKSSLP